MYKQTFKQNWTCTRVQGNIQTKLDMHTCTSKHPNKIDHVHVQAYIPKHPFISNKTSNAYIYKQAFKKPWTYTHVQSNIQTKLDMDACTSKHSNKIENVHGQGYIPKHLFICNQTGHTHMYKQTFKQNFICTRAQAYIQTNLNMYTCKQTFQNIHLSSTNLDMQTCTNKHFTTSVYLQQNWTYTYV